MSDKKIKTIGIIGGGQLGRMTAQAAQNMGFAVVIFSDIEESPASFVVDNVVVADYKDEKALKKFADLVDVITFEFENIPLSTVEFLSKFKEVFPKSEVLKITQHRVLEKGFLNSIGVKTANYAEIKNLEDLISNLKDFGKGILKTATMGYDGKGQFVLTNENEAKDAYEKAKDLPLILEGFCNFSQEISAVVMRGKNGEIDCYEPLTNIHKDGILDKSIYPAKISKELTLKAQEIAKKIAVEIDLVGVLAVEFFVVEDELLVNELAPRPHNSGHFSMDSSKTSQFEQLVRALSGQEFGSCEFIHQGYMQNFIGDDYLKIDEYKNNENAKIHTYDKKEIRSGRKMAHVNFIE